MPGALLAKSEKRLEMLEDPCFMILFSRFQEENWPFPAFTWHFGSVWPSKSVNSEEDDASADVAERSAVLERAYTLSQPRGAHSLAPSC